MSNEGIVLSGMLGRAVLYGENTDLYAEAILHGRSADLTYGDVQEFKDFTSKYFVLKKDEATILLHKDTGETLSLTSENPITFYPDGGSVSDFADTL